MLKRTIVILLVYSILVQGGTKLGIYAYFQLNKDYISKVLCINKEKPSLHCNGKCFLSKQLKSQSEKEEKTPSQIKVVDSILFCDRYSITIPVPFQVLKPQLHSNYLFDNYHVYPPSVFHPPLA